MGGLRTGIRPVHISPSSRMVIEYSGMLVQPHKAIVGANAFAHESGIHQDGMLKNRSTYEVSWASAGIHEGDAPKSRASGRAAHPAHPGNSGHLANACRLHCHARATPTDTTGDHSHVDATRRRHPTRSQIMSPETIGLTRKDEAGIVLGKHSGRHALTTALRNLGYELDESKMDQVFKRFKEVAEQKKSGITDDDLEALLGDQVFQPETVWEVLDLQVVCGTMGLPTATVRLKGPDGLARVATSVGTGPVDAAYQAIDSLVQVCGLRGLSGVESRRWSAGE